MHHVHSRDGAVIYESCENSPMYKWLAGGLVGFLPEGFGAKYAGVPGLAF